MGGAHWSPTPRSAHEAMVSRISGLAFFQPLMWGSPTPELANPVHPQPGCIWILGCEEADAKTGSPEPQPESGLVSPQGSAQPRLRPERPCERAVPGAR